jgi:hypothetical protein
MTKSVLNAVCCHIPDLLRGPSRATISNESAPTRNKHSLRHSCTSQDSALAVFSLADVGTMHLEIHDSCHGWRDTSTPPSGCFDYLTTWNLKQPVRPRPTSA